jgi:hypothetical protein
MTPVPVGCRNEHHCSKFIQNNEREDLLLTAGAGAAAAFSSLSFLFFSFFLSLLSARFSSVIVG